MADNIAVTPGSGATIAADDVSNVLYQIIKVALGADGSATFLDGNSGNKSAGTLRVVLATDQPALTNAQPVTPAATEAHLGEVGGNSTGVKVALTVSTSPAYTAGDSIGGKITIANALRAAGHNVVLQNVHILDRANQKPTGSILIFDADPSAATLTDNAAFVYSTDDLKQIARIPVASSDWATINSKATASLPNLGRVLTAASGTTLYAAFVTDSTPTFAATSDVQIVFGFLRD